VEVLSLLAFYICLGYLLPSEVKPKDIKRKEKKENSWRVEELLHRFTRATAG
jgi:hypothetical protein